MRAYLDLMRHVRERGLRKTDRTGTGTLSVFGHQLRFDLSAGFPLVTTKRVHLKSVIEELLWFLRGETNVRSLQEKGVSIWNEWADARRRARSRLRPAVACLAGRGRAAHRPDRARDSPAAARAGFAAHHRQRLECRGTRKDGARALPCVVPVLRRRGRLSCQVYQRSADIFLGVPFNIASYALLTHILAQQSDLSVGDLVWTGGDCHLYLNHLEQADTQLARTPQPLPTLAMLRRPADIADYRYEDFQVLGYEPHAAIRAPVAV